MKSARKLILLLLISGYISGISSCTVTFKTNNGKHTGWFKNPKNPHHPKHGNSGNKGNGKSHNKGKKK